MSGFEFIMVLVAIIMGLGITSLLEGAVRALRADTATKPGLLHGVWVVTLVLLHTQVWLSRWRASSRPEWLLSEILFFLYLPIVLFGLAKLVFPEHGREVELTPYFLENRRAFFGLLALAHIGVALGPSVFLDGGGPFGERAWNPLLALVPIPLCGWMAWSGNDKLHLVIALAYAFVTVAVFAYTKPLITCC